MHDTYGKERCGKGTTHVRLSHAFPRIPWRTQPLALVLLLPKESAQRLLGSARGSSDSRDLVLSHAGDVRQERWIIHGAPDEERYRLPSREHVHNLGAGGGAGQQGLHFHVEVSIGAHGASARDRHSGD